MTQASEKQLAFITKLLNEKDINKSEHTVYLVAVSTLITTNSDQLTKANASKAIDMLMAIKASAKAKASATLEPGFYVYDSKVYKVVISPNSGHNYAKVLIDGTWEYAAGALKNLYNMPALTLEEAKAYGKLYGT